MILGLLLLHHQFAVLHPYVADEIRVYTPDFMVMLADGRLEAHEVKGFWREDARAKIKIAVY